MNDTISRQAAIDALRYAQHRFIVADEAGGMGTVKWSEDVIYFAAAERVLSDLPSVQPEVLAHGEGELSAQPEMIRCKDCIYFDKYIDCKEMYQWDGFCADWARNTYENWYCSRAEKRNDG